MDKHITLEFPQLPCGNILHWIDMWAYLNFASVLLARPLLFAPLWGRRSGGRGHRGGGRRLTGCWCRDPLEASCWHSRLWCRWWWHQDNRSNSRFGGRGWLPLSAVRAAVVLSTMVMVVAWLVEPLFEALVTAVGYSGRTRCQPWVTGWPLTLDNNIKRMSLYIIRRACQLPSWLLK